MRGRAVLGRLNQKVGVEMSQALARIFHSRFINTGLQPGEPRRNERRAVSTASTPREKPLKRLLAPPPATTGLKPGVNKGRAIECEISGLIVLQKRRQRVHLF